MLSEICVLFIQAFTNPQYDMLKYKYIRNPNKQVYYYCLYELASLSRVPATTDSVEKKLL